MSGTLIKIDAYDEQKIDIYVSIPEASHSPGLLLLPDKDLTNDIFFEIANLFCEEGYVVVAPLLFPHDTQTITDQNAKPLSAFNADQAMENIGASLSYLRQVKEFTGMVATLGFGIGGKMSYLAAAHYDLDVCVSFYAPDIEALLDKADDISCPIQMHFAELDKNITEDAIANIKKHFKNREDVKIYLYPNVEPSFYCNTKDNSYNRPAALISHSRTIAVLHKTIGPNFDLEALWENHIKFEFGTRDTEATLATMVGDPYVNHIPTMTGGTGFEELRRFYKNHFIPKLPKDTHLIPISRTVGADRIVDEMIFCFTHDEEIDWMLPGVSPTGKNVEIPLIAIVNFRGGKLYNEHIYWDQASVLVQIGELDPSNLPVAGVETAHKVKDMSLPSNTLMSRWAQSAPQLKTK